MGLLGLLKLEEGGGRVAVAIGRRVAADRTVAVEAVFVVCFPSGPVMTSPGATVLVMVEEL